MADNPELKHTDRRTIERYIRSGQQDDKAYEKFIKTLPDLADKSEPILTRMEDDVAADEDDLDEDDLDDDEGPDEAPEPPHTEPGPTEPA